MKSPCSQSVSDLSGFSPDGRLFALCEVEGDGTLIYDVRSGRKLWTLEVEHFWQFTPDGRHMVNLIARSGGRPVLTFQQSKNPFWIKIQADFSMDPSQVLDRRLALAAAILITAIEGTQGER